MPFKQNSSFVKEKGYSVGDSIERVAFDNLVAKKREEERERLGAESKERKDINRFIAKRVEQGWPREMIIEAARNQFPNIALNRIESLTLYWEKKFKRMVTTIDNIIEKVKRRELTKEEADYKMNPEHSPYTMFRVYALKYYEEKLDALEQESR